MLALENSNEKQKFSHGFINPHIWTILILLSGILFVVLAYTAMGSVLFMTLEGEDEMGKTVETAVAASKPRTDLVNADIRSR